VFKVLRLALSTLNRFATPTFAKCFPLLIFLIDQGEKNHGNCKKSGTQKSRSKKIGS
jgi:hypothetical protein